MKTRIVGLLSAVLVMSAPAIAAAQEDSSPLPGSFSGNIAITSDYVFRGYTQTSEDPAVQGGFDWDSGMGIYVGTWASSLEFGGGDDASMELDLYAGYAGSVNNFSYDIGFLYYLYPASSGVGYNFWEVYGSAGYDFGPAAITFGINYTPDYYATSGDNGVYYYSELSVPIGDMFSVSGAVGRSVVQNASNWTDWNVGASVDVYDWFSLDARYYDTDVKACTNVCDSRFVVSISKSF